MQRHLSDLFTHERKLRWPHPSGLVESNLAADALENLMVKFDRLRAVMPSGVYVNAPGNAEIPALNIKELRVLLLRPSPSHPGRAPLVRRARQHGG